MQSATYTLYSHVDVIPSVKCCIVGRSETIHTILNISQCCLVCCYPSTLDVQILPLMNLISLSFLLCFNAFHIQS